MSESSVGNSNFGLNLSQQQAEGLANGALASGRKTQRLNSLSTDKTIQIAAKSLTPSGLSFFQKHNYVQLEGTEILLNIRSTAKRLGIAPKEVTDSLAKGGVSALQKAVKTREAVLVKYKALADKSGWGLSGGKNTLLKICQASIDKESHEFKAAKISVKLSGKIHTIYVEPELKVFSFLEKRLGGGTFGSVHRVKAFYTEQNKIIKEKEALKESSVKDTDAKSLNNEVQIVNNKLHENASGPLHGIPDKFKEVHIITGSDQKKIGFVRTTLMDGDLSSDGEFIPKFQDLSTEKRLGLCFQLIQGLEHTHQKGLIHGDIKPANCLMKENDNGEPVKFILGDFGGAVETKNLRKEGVTTTASYRPYEMTNTKWTDLNHKIAANQKADVYALGFTLIELLTSEKLVGKVPSQQVIKSEKNKKGIEKTKKTNYPDSDQIKPDSDFYTKEFNALINSAIPQSIAKLLLKAIGPIETRPTATEFKTQFSEALKNMTHEEKNKLGDYNRLNALNSF